MKSISIIVPVLNESGNIVPLVNRIAATLHGLHTYEIIFIDDHSTDTTKAEILSCATYFPVQYFKKQGQPGKAQSLLEGFSYAKYDLLCMIDSDLQYPPEALPAMIDDIENGSDVVVARRTDPHTSKARSFASKSFNYIFCKFLHNLDFDVQSGMKVFRKEIIDRVYVQPFPWSFDLEFLTGARAAGYKISSHDIEFVHRNSGSSKVHLFTASFQIGYSAILLKLAQEKIIPFHKDKQLAVGQGFHYKNQEFIHFSELSVLESAVTTVVRGQQIFMIVVLFVLSLCFAINWEFTLIVIIGLLTLLYFCDLVFNLYLILRSFRTNPEIRVTEAEIDRITEWPSYTVFCPLYKEWKVVRQFVDAIERMDYPKDKLQVQLLLEEDDTETIRHIQNIKMPSYFEMVIVPNTLPKTKPKACNYGLRYATGEYAVIYDAEDMPDPQQLKKAVIAFEKTGPQTACIQAKLNYYNSSQNLLTRLFTAEYSLWFDLILTGLQSLNAPIPLGGTSNHFKVARLREVKGWDSFNVTEDCDLGLRLVSRGYRTAIVDSVTLEEANSHFFNWINQRSRWIKGYMQTYLVHMRNPRKMIKPGNYTNFMYFQLIVGGKILSLFVNPFMWMLTILYFALRIYIGETIEKFFPPAVFYMAVFSLVAGNFLYLYYYMIGCAKRKQYELIKFVFVIPLYWIAMSIAAWKGLIQLIVSPHYWQKTKHGLHLKDEPEFIDETANFSPLPFSPIPENILNPAATPEPKKEQKQTSKKASKKVSFNLNWIFSLFNRKNENVWSLGTLSSGTVLILALIGSNALNFVFNTYFGRTLGYGDFGLLTLVNTLSFFIAIIFSALSSTINHRVSYLTGSRGTPHAAQFLRNSYVLVLIRVAIFALVWSFLTPFTLKYFHLNSTMPVLAVLIIILFGVVNSINEGYLGGTFSFASLAVLIVTIPGIKLLAGLLLQYTNNHALIYLAIPISYLLPVFLSSFIVFNKIKNIPPLHRKEKYTFPSLFYMSSLLNGLSVFSYISIDILLVQHYLPAEAGKYAILSLAGKMIFFFGSLTDRFIIPFVSREIGEHRNPARIFNIIFSVTLTMTCIVFTAIGIFGQYTMPLIFGAKIVPVLPYLFEYSIAIANITLTNTVLAYHLSRHHYSFPILAMVNTLFLFLGISMYHGSIQDIVNVLLYVSTWNIISMVLLHLLQQNGKFFIKNIIDLVCLVLPLPSGYSDEKGKKILIFNWRDTKHVYAGGAELYIHELAKRFVKEGNTVVLFCGNDGHNPRNESIDGVQIIRRGGFYMVYVWAFLYYILRFRSRFDVIIDCENGIPFFTPLYAGEKSFLLIHHVHQEVFRNSLIGPLAAFATFLEMKVMPFVYKNIQIITVSESSKKEIEAQHLSTKEPVIIYNGVDTNTYKPGLRDHAPVVTYIGRLKKYKSIDVFLKSAKIVLEVAPKVKFVIGGDGEEMTTLKQMAKKLGIEKNVEFFGKLSEDRKLALYQRSWVFVQPSFMEGWSLTTLEANACGVPVVASRVAGLRDAVRDGETGYLAEYGNEQVFAEKILFLLFNEEKRNTMSENALRWARHFSWENSSNEAIKTLFNLQKNNNTGYNYTPLWINTEKKLQ
ncbi:hypothetical protein BH09PAT2_BH09PAT2_02020 [soil metagenome]